MNCAVGKPNWATDCIIAVDELLSFVPSIESAAILAAAMVPVVILLESKSGISELTRLAPAVAIPLLLTVSFPYVPAEIPLVDVVKFPEESTLNPPPD